MPKPKPMVILENYKEDGELKSVLQYKDDSKKRFILIPKWVVVLACAIAIFLFFTLIVSLIVVSSAKPPATFQQSCEGRSCMKNLNLKCLNNTCQCDTGYFYISKCVLKKSFMEQCKNTSQCKDNANLVCNDGVCKCKAFAYWDGKQCINKTSYGQPCTNNSQCLTNNAIICDKNTSTCSCDKTTR